MKRKNLLIMLFGAILLISFTTAGTFYYDESCSISDNIFNYAEEHPSFSKMPEKQDEYLGVYNIDGKDYKLYETPLGNKFLGGYR